MDVNQLTGAGNRDHHGDLKDKTYSLAKSSTAGGCNQDQALPVFVFSYRGKVQFRSQWETNTVPFNLLGWTWHLNIMGINLITPQGLLCLECQVEWDCAVLQSVIPCDVTINNSNQNVLLFSETLLKWISTLLWTFPVMNWTSVTLQTLCFAGSLLNRIWLPCWGLDLCVW